MTIISSLFLCVVCTIVTERIVEPRMGEYQGERPADTGGEVSSEEARGLRFSLYALIGVGILIALLALPSAAP
ncbi:MAG: AbgT family transporter, partial [Microbacterium sp.]|nr:AbgT family transporter [Microbacterium sp.]